MSKSAKRTAISKRNQGVRVVDPRTGRVRCNACGEIFDPVRREGTMNVFACPNGCSSRRSTEGR